MSPAAHRNEKSDNHHDAGKQCAEARPGQKIAIVGSTGAGKTTLVNLLMRFYETDGGQILLDGQDTGSMTRADLRGAFGMVLQDAWLFEGTIAENIAYGRPDASREEIIAAAKAARADFFIRTLPHGYETVLSNDADNISIGQRQLLTIARVFLCDPKILILDEATSSVDTRTELEIGSAMQALMQNFFLSTNSAVQRAGIAALTCAEADVLRMHEIYDERRRFLLEALPKLGFRIPVEPCGAFYMLINARHLGTDSRALAFDLLEKAHIGVTPGIDFGSQTEGFLRLSYANSIENLREAMRRLEQYIRNA